MQQNKFVKKKQTSKIKMIVLIGIAAIAGLYLCYWYVWEYHRHRWMSLDEICSVTDEGRNTCNSEKCQQQCSQRYCWLTGGILEETSSYCQPDYGYEMRKSKRDIEDLIPPPYEQKAE